MIYFPSLLLFNKVHLDSLQVIPKPNFFVKNFNPEIVQRSENLVSLAIVLNSLLILPEIL